MSRIKDNIFVNGQLVGNPIRKEICQTDNGRCDQCINVPETNKGSEKNITSRIKIKIWDPAWITPFGDTTCRIRNKICKKSHCIEKWIELEKHFSKASKHSVVTSQENKENCAISSNNTNGRKHCSKPSIRQPGHQNNSEKQMSRQYENKTKKNKKRHHVIPGMSSSAAIVPFLSTQSIILRHYIIFGKYIIKMMVILQFSNFI